MSSLLVPPDSVRQVFNDTEEDVLWLVFGAPNEAANTLEMSEETIAFMYPDGLKALPPELAAMTDRLHFTGNEEADRLLVEDPFALLVGFALDQQVPVQKAFMGPYVLRERLGTLEPAAVAAADLDPIFRERPAIHRFPGAMATRVHELAVHVVERYDGDAARVWTTAHDHRRAAREHRRPAGLRHDEDQGARLGAGQALRRRAGGAAGAVAPDARGRRLAAALKDYQASKKVNKAALGGLTAEHGERALAGLLAVAVGL